MPIYQQNIPSRRGGITGLLSMSAPDMPDLEAMTKAELVEYAEGLGISGLNTRMVKADIIAAIKGAMGQ